MNIRSLRIQAVTVSVVMALVTGCGTASDPASSAAQPDPELTDITVAALPAADLAGLYIALDQGLFTKQGLRVTIEPIPSSQAIIPDQLKGQVDISAGSYIPYIAAQAAGARFRVLAEASTLRPDTRVLVTTANSPIVTVAGLTGKMIAVNATNSIGTLLTSVLLSDHGISPERVRFVTDQQGFPAMPASLQAGTWGAAFLAEPYITAAGEQYGEEVLADLDQGAVLSLPVDGYVATQAWALKYPRTAAAFTRAIEQGQQIANSDASAVQATMARNDSLPAPVTAAMALPRYPVGPVVEANIQRVARAMYQSGILGQADATDAEQQALVASMADSAS